LFPRFLLRANLGSLARDLRFLGYDAAIYQEAGFDNLARIAAHDGRMILTRSRKEASQKKSCLIRLINGDDSFQQILQLSDLIGFKEEFIFWRCSICNKLLYEIDKEKIINLVPEYVYETQTKFRICRFCGRIYWKGDHYQAIYKRLKNLFEEG
jgi:uncharacterized protein with PIN domain